MATISGSIYDFVDLGYIPPTWSGGVYGFGEPASTAVYQLSPDINNNGYLYAATNLGLVIVDVETELEHARAVNNHCTSVANSDDKIFIGTTNSGIYALDKSTISSGTLTEYLYQYKAYPNITSNYVKYLHGQSDYLCAATAAGIDFYWLSINDRDFRIIADTYKCFVCTDGKTYYTTSGTSNRIYRTNVPVGVAYPPVMYTCGSGYLESVPNVQDIYVTERTSSVETTLWPENTLFIAASGSAFIFDEGSKEILEYRIGGPT